MLQMGTRLGSWRLEMADRAMRQRFERWPDRSWRLAVGRFELMVHRVR